MADLVKIKDPDVLNECHIAVGDLECTGNHFSGDVHQLHQFWAYPPRLIAQGLDKATLATFYSNPPLTNYQRSAVAGGEVGSLRLGLRFYRGK